MNNSLLINQHLLLENIEKFYKRFYLNKLLKGGLIATGLVLSLFLLVGLAEYYGNFNSTIRFVLFYGFLVFIFCAQEMEHRMSNRGRNFRLCFIGIQI